MYKHKVVWITGASSGIGEALAKAFATEGTKLVLSARRETELRRVASQCIAAGLSDDNVLIVPMDVTALQSHGNLVAKVKEYFGRIDVLINNAGISQRSLAVDTDISVYKRLLDVDVVGPISLTKAVLPVMLEQNSGQLVVTSSVAGKVGVKLRTGYCAAKHAVMGFFDALRAELASSGITVTTIVPGAIRTQVSVHALNGDGGEFGEMTNFIANGMDADRCAQVILRGLKRGMPEIAVGNGREMHALWLKRLSPRLLFRLVGKTNAA